MIEQVKEDIERVTKNLISLAYNWDQLEAHEQEQLKIAADQSDFPYEIHDLVSHFRHFQDYSDRLTVIDGIQIQIYEHDNGSVSFILGNHEYTIKTIHDLRDLVKDTINKDIALKIIDWYLKRSVSASPTKSKTRFGKSLLVTKCDENG